jgi:ribosomal protein S17
MNGFKLINDVGRLHGVFDPEFLNGIQTKMAQLHLNSLSRPAKVAKPEKSVFLGPKDEDQISSYLNKISGLERLKKELAAAPGGKELADNIIKTKGIDLLFGGQLDIPARVNNLHKILNDRNGRDYIKYTLGEKVYNELKVLDRLNKLESRLKEIEKNREEYDIATDPDVLIKGGEVLVDILKARPFAATKKTWNLIKTIKRKKRGESAPQERLSYEIR